MKPSKKVPAVQNPRTGSYTVPVPQSARTGKTLTERPTVTGEIVVLRDDGKQSFPANNATQQAEKEQS